jgi:hypothetical protein
MNGRKMTVQTCIQFSVVSLVRWRSGMHLKPRVGT